MRQTFLHGGSSFSGSSGGKRSEIIWTGRNMSSGDDVPYAPVPSSGTLNKFRIETSEPVTQELDFSLIKNQVDSAPNVTILNGGTVGESDDGTSVNAGDIISAKGESAFGYSGSFIMSWSIRFTPSNTTKAIAMGCIPTSSIFVVTPSTTREYTHIIGYGISFDTTESTRYYYCPMSGTIENLYIMLERTFTGTATFVFSIFKNGSEEVSSQVTIDDTHTLRQVHSVTGLSIAFASGDTLTLSGIRTAGTFGWDQVGSGTLSWGFQYTPTIQGESMVGGCTNQNLSTVQNTIQHGFLNRSNTNGPNIGFTTDESKVKALIGEKVIIKNFRVNLSDAPGANQSREFRLRKNSGNGNALITISDSSTSGSSNNTDSCIMSDLVNISTKPTTASCAATKVFWSAIMKVNQNEILARPMYFK